MSSDAPAKRLRWSIREGPLIWWYLSLLVLTVVFKALCLREIYSGGIRGVLRSGAGSSDIVSQLWQAGWIFSIDALEVGIVVAAMAIVGCGLLRIKASVMILSSTLVALLFSAANLMSCVELSSYLSRRALGISIDWIKANPDTLGAWIGWKAALLVPVAVIWACGPMLMSRLAASRPFGPPIRMVTRASVLLLALALFAYLSYGWLNGRGDSVDAKGYWSASLSTLLGRNDEERLPEPPEPKDLIAQFESLVYPEGPTAGDDRRVELPARERKPRHILIVSLETAPRKYYPLIDNQDLPAFYRMSRRAIVSDMHYSNTPFTTRANFAMLSGTYPSRGRSLSTYGSFQTDGLASVLGEQGYEATYIDSWHIDWHDTDKNRRTVEDLGFAHMVDQSDLGSKGARDREVRAMGYAQKCVLDAHQNGRKALVFVDTMRGHHPWRTPPGDPRGPAGGISDIVHEFDALFGSLLDVLEQHELLDDVIIVVTGDHGLRYRKEYDSLGEEMKHPDLAFNVPLLIYAPGLVDSQIRVPCVTSHVDITPSLLDLVGISSDGMVHHGQSILAPRLCDRVVFMLNTGLIPLDVFHWKNYFFTYNQSTAMAKIATDPDGSDARPIRDASDAYPGIPKALLNPRAVLETANQLIDLTAAHELARGREESGRQLTHVVD